jgi:hypothetical protein
MIPGERETREREKTKITGEGEKIETTGEREGTKQFVFSLSPLLLFLAFSLSPVSRGAARWFQ